MVRPVAYHHQQNTQIPFHDGSADDEEIRQQHHQPSQLTEAPCSPAESDSTSSGCSSAAAGSNSDRDGSPRRQTQNPAAAAAVDQPGSILPSGADAASGDGASTCCGGCTGDGEGSTRSAERSMSRGVGYCCTVQPLDRPVTPLPPLPPTSPIQQCSVDVTGTCRDQLPPPRLVSPADRRSSSRPHPPPLPPPRRTSLKRDRKDEI